MSASTPEKLGLPGRFVVLEGIDGSGSTTQLERLAVALRARGRIVHTTSEPTSGPIGALIRQILQKRIPLPDGTPRPFAWSTMALLFAADRVDHVDNEILPKLRAGVWVLSDRYDLSSLAYQSATSPEPERVVPWIQSSNSHAIRPDLTLVLDVPADVAAERRGLRGGAEELYEKHELQRRLADVYAHAEALVPGDRLVHVLGTGGVELVAARVLDAVLAQGF